MGVRQTGGRGTVAVALAALLAGCTFSAPLPSPTDSPSAAPRDFTVLTTERVGTTDPAAMTTDVETIVALNLFQRLMLVIPGTGQLRPDLAQECLFTGPKVFECKLPKGLTFSNGHELTSSDVRFSILRALRLRVPGTSMSLLGSLDKVEVPDPQTVRFRLLWPDSQFGWALAGAAASVVDEEAYDTDRPRPVNEMPFGSGPYQLEVLDKDGFTLSRSPRYVGPRGTEMPKIRVSYADSATAEKAINDGSTELVWRTLDQPAIDRLTEEIQLSPDRVTAQGFRQWDLPGTRVRRLGWNPSSARRSDANLRRVVALALQADRSLDSLVPSKVSGHIAAYPIGGNPTVPTVKGRRVLLGLSYPSSSPGLADLARTLRDRLEGSAGVSVQVLPDDPGADLQLTERDAWINTSLGWLQEYLDHPLPGSSEKLNELEHLVSTSASEQAREVALGEIQKQAAADLTVLPISQGPTTLFVGPKVDLVGDAFGPAWQLGLWGARWKA